MIIKKIYVEVGFTKSLPNYQNVRPLAGVEVELEEGEVLEDVYARAWEIVGDELAKQLEVFDEKDTGKIKRGL